MRHALRFAGKNEFPAKVIVISPHADDAAFSLAATLKFLSSAGSAIRIINCFTVSRFAPFAEKESGVSAVTRRRHEEEHFVFRLGGNSTFDDLGLVDAPGRNGRGVRGILAQNSTAEEMEAAADMLRQSLEECMDENGKGAALIAPLGIGGHVDHCIARMAAVAGCRRLPIAFYEDLPYAAAARGTQIENAVAETAARLRGDLWPMVFQWPGDAEWKASCCAQYKSQISEAGVRKITEYMARIRGERLWCSAAFLRGWKWEATFRLPTAWPEPLFV